MDINWISTVLDIGHGAEQYTEDLAVINFGYQLDRTVLDVGHGAEQYTEDLAVINFGYQLDRTVLDIVEAVHCLMPSLI